MGAAQSFFDRQDFRHQDFVEQADKVLLCLFGEKRKALHWEGAEFDPSVDPQLETLERRSQAGPNFFQRFF